MRTLLLISLAIGLLLPATVGAEVKSAQDLRQDWQDIADLVALGGREHSAANIMSLINALPDRELEKIYGSTDLSPIIGSLKETQTVIEAVDALGLPVSVKDLAAGARLPVVGARGDRSATKSAGFPTNLDYPDGVYCPYSPNRSDGLALQIAVDAITAARIALEVAKGIWSGLSRACEETIVILGEGGNASLACIPVDIALFVAEGLVGAAEGVVEHFSACDGGVDSAEIEGTWDGLVHTHTDLVNHDGALQTHDGDMKALVDNLQDSVNENQRLITILMSRQLEVMKLLITQEGQRAINADVLTCTGPDCPQVLQCRNGSLDWPCK